MTLQEIEERLKGIEGGADIMAAIKNEITTLRNEAKTERIAKSELMKQLGLDGDKAQDSAKAIADLLAQLKAENKEPSGVLSEITGLKTSVSELTKKYEEAAKKAAESEVKRQESLKASKLMEALTTGKAVAPAELAKILKDSVQLKEDGSVVYLGADQKELGLQDGVDAYLKANPWAMSINPNPGGGTHSPAGGTPDYEKMSIDEYFKARESENK